MLYSRIFFANLSAIVFPYLDGKKYPLERGEYYQPDGLDDDEKRKKATEWALAERSGKYLSSGGIVYNSKYEYLQKQKEMLNK